MISELVTPTWLLELRYTDEERWRIIADSIPQIESIARYAKDFDFDEAYDIVLQSAQKCVLRYDESLGKFSFYLRTAARNDLNRARLKRAAIRTVEFQDSDSPICERQTDHERAEYEERVAEAYSELERQIRALGNSYWQLWCEWVLNGSSQDELAEKFHVTRSAISMRIHKIRQVCAHIDMC